MTARRLLLDEMLSRVIAAQLRARGFDAVAVVEDTQLIAMPDEDLLAHATRERRCLVTVNIADFAVIAADWRTHGRAHAGIAYLPSRIFPQDRSFVGAVVRALVALQEAGAPGDDTETYLRRPE